MPKLPRVPDRARLEALKPGLMSLPAGQQLSRVYFRTGRHPVRWYDLRYFGPVHSARFDHHEPASDGSGQLQSRGIIYSALVTGTSLAGLDVCLAEVFQQLRTVSRSVDTPAWAVFTLTAEITLLDLRGKWPTKAGASQALNSGPNSSARRWAHAFYEIYPQIQSIGSISGPFPDFQQYPEPCQAGVWPGFRPAAGRISPDFRLSSPT